MINGLKWKQPVRAASTANVALSGGASLSIDGVSLADGDRVLLKDQTSGAENGIYVVSGIGSAYALTRAADADSAEELKSATVFVQEGTANADKAFTQTVDTITLETTALTFVEFGAGSVTSVNGQTGVVVLDTDDISEGATNLYYTTARFNTDFATKDTDDLAEGVTNLYHTAQRARDAISFGKQAITLVAQDITNGYVDLAGVIKANSAWAMIQGGLPGIEDVDYTISLTGGVGGVTRLTFAGDWASGGASALAAGDVLHVKYMHEQTFTQSSDQWTD